MKFSTGTSKAKPGIMALLKQVLLNLEHEFIQFYDNRVKGNYNEELYPPFWYSERTTNTFFTIALSQISELKGNILQEFPVDRACGNNTVSGRIDYLCYWEDKIVAFELKQSFIPFTMSAKSINKHNFLQQHQKAIEQLVSLEDASKNWLNASIAITILPVCMINDSLGKQLTENDFNSIVQFLENALGKDMRRTREKQFIAGFNLPPRLAKIPVKCPTRNESYPAVFLIVTIREGLGS